MERYGRSFRETWSYNHSCFGCSWPPRSYICSFCKREFRSAQALGGHMNVHRRDRARLRQSLPWVDESFTSPNPNPNINHRPFTSPTSISTYHVPNLNSPPPPSYATCSMPSQPALLAPHSGDILFDEPKWAAHAVKTFFVEDLNALMEDDAAGATMRKEREVVRLGLEIEMLGHGKEELDLELRLG